MGKTKYNDDKVAFEENNLTSSKIRYARMIEAFDKVPKAKLGGATYQWINRSCNQFKYLWLYYIIWLLFKKHVFL